MRLNYSTAPRLDVNRIASFPSGGQDFDALSNVRSDSVTEHKGRAGFRIHENMAAIGTLKKKSSGIAFELPRTDTEMVYHVAGSCVWVTANSQIWPFIGTINRTDLASIAGSAGVQLATEHPLEHRSDVGSTANMCHVNCSIRVQADLLALDPADEVLVFGWTCYNYSGGNLNPSVFAHMAVRRYDQQDYPLDPYIQ